MLLPLQWRGSRPPRLCGIKVNVVRHALVLLLRCYCVPCIPCRKWKVLVRRRCGAARHAAMSFLAWRTGRSRGLDVLSQSGEAATMRGRVSTVTANQSPKAVASFFFFYFIHTLYTPKVCNEWTFSANSWFFLLFRKKCYLVTNYCTISESICPEQSYLHAICKLIGIFTLFEHD